MKRWILAVIVASFAASSLAQSPSTRINPGSQIRWPSCNPGMVYAPATNTCVTTQNGALSPSAIAAGAGSEAAPFIHADSTAGIQTQVNALQAGRGGKVALSSNRFNIAAPIKISHSSIVVACDAQGYNNDPNGEIEGVSGCKLRLDPALTAGNIFQIGCGGSVAPGCAGNDRAGAIRLENLEMYGNGTTVSPANAAPYQDNAAVAFTGQQDQFTAQRIFISNFGIGFHFGRGGFPAADLAEISNVKIVDSGVGFYVYNDTEIFYLSVVDSDVYDNDGPAVLAPTALYDAGASFINDRFIRTCRNAAVCAFGGHPANIVWSRPFTTWTNIHSEAAGVCSANIAGFHCPAGGSQIHADGMYLTGGKNTITGGTFTGQKLNGDAAIHVAGGIGNIIDNPAFDLNAIDILVDSAASDTVIWSVSRLITDNGVRTVINNNSKNSGDPDVTGNWAIASKWPGLTIIDTVNSQTYLYTAAGRINITVTNVFPVQIQVGPHTVLHGNPGNFYCLGGANCGVDVVNEGAGSTDNAAVNLFSGTGANSRVLNVFLTNPNYGGGPTGDYAGLFTGAAQGYKFLNSGGGSILTLSQNGAVTLGTAGIDPSWSKGSGVPSGSCKNGSFYSRVDTGAFYVCQALAWVAK